MTTNSGELGVVLGIYLVFNSVGAFVPLEFPGGGLFAGLPLLTIGQGNQINRNKKVDPYFRQNFPYWVDGISKDGRPVYTNPIGKWDIAAKVSNKGKSEEFKDYVVSNLEEVDRAIKKATEMKPGNHDVKQAICIFDWDGFDWSQVFNFQAIYDILQFARIYEKYYSGNLHMLYFINCADLITQIVNLMQPIIAPDTKKRLKVYNKDKEVWQRDILRYVDADQIRPAFGGTKNDDKNPFVTNKNSTNPANGTNLVSGTNPANGTKTANVINPANGTKTVSEANPANGINPASGHNPSNGTNPVDVNNSANGTNPVDVNNPSNGTNPVDVNNPANGTHPTNDTDPASGTNPANGNSHANDTNQDNGADLEVATS